MAGLPRTSRDFHLSIATRGLSPSTFEAGPIAVRGFYLLGSRHPAGTHGRGSQSARDVVNQQMTVRATFQHKIWDSTLMVQLGNEDMLKMSAQFVREVAPDEIIVSAEYLGAHKLDK